jgi:hypothetical protein
MTDRDPWFVEESIARGGISPNGASPARLNTTPLADVSTPDVERITSTKTLPLFAGMLHGLVGPSEVGKTTTAAHAVLDVADAGDGVLVLDGEMSAGAWRRKLTQLGAMGTTLGRVHYAEIAESSAAVDLVRGTVTTLAIRLIVWDSALSLLSRTARSENDNAEVGRVLDRLRAIVRDGPAGLVVDHSALASGQLVSRGASAKFAALDVSYGVKLVEGCVPGPLDHWSSLISIEKDRHGLLGERHDREITFIPLGHGMLAVDLAELGTRTHRLVSTNPIVTLTERIAQLDPPATSANDAYKRIGGTRSAVLNAYKLWFAAHGGQGGSGGTGSIEPYHRTTPTVGPSEGGSAVRTTQAELPAT